tara:strand:+ start:414 stop:1721 length:1308 start_codon:yes stop_codon:yes gene_type:complete
MAIFHQSPGNWFSFTKRLDNNNLSINELKSKYNKEKLLFENYVTNFQQMQQALLTQQAVGVGGAGSKKLSVYQFSTNIELFNAVTEWTNDRAAALIKYGNISTWDVSLITSFKGLFEVALGQANGFNDDINNWNTSNVTDMSCMFEDQTLFNQPLDKWDTSKVTDMSEMFKRSNAFNQNIGSWSTSNVSTMAGMFTAARAFNQDLNSWDTGNVTGMSFMFFNAESFNGDISNWNTSKVNNLNDMFNGAEIFNQPLNSWDVSQVINMSRMFRSDGSPSAFNQDLNSWDTGNVTNMTGMFQNAQEFNGNITGWNTEKVTDMNIMFGGANEFNQNIGSWNVGLVTDMSNMLSSTKFNHSLASWQVENVANMNGMFNNSQLNTTNYDAILIGWSALSSLQSAIALGANVTKYSAGAAATARGVLTGAPNNWVITDDGQV